ncbi:hypothetical protein AAVH_29312 [Aphelenchoides avenae]|nr:hypothetical protein AAVH_29312 [Aphelenchus avenae]
MSSALLWYLPYELPLLTFLGTVSYMIWRQRRRGNARFKSHFYAIYLVQSVADMVEYLLVNTHPVSALATVIKQFAYIRLPRYGLMSEAVLNFPVENLMPFFLGYALYFEYLAHVAVALNRFSVLSKAA